MAASIFLGMLSEILLWNGGIIDIPESAKYSQQDALNPITYAVTSTNNSIEAAANELRRKMPEASIPCADTVHTYIKTANRIEEILAFFRGLYSVFLELLTIPNTPQDFAIDFHNEGYYGEKNAEGVRGIQPKNGTSWGHVYFTIDWLGGKTATLVEGVVHRIRAMGLKIRIIISDRELFNLAAISTFNALGADFIMAAQLDKRIKKILELHKRENGRKPTIFAYKFRDERSPEFYLVAIQNPEYDPAMRETKGKREFLLFATSMAFGSVEEFVKRVPQEYRRRWKIETGYRVKKDFKIRTCSRSYIARVLFFVIQCIMHNFLNVLKMILRITAHQLKSFIVEDVEKYLNRGLFLNRISLRKVYAKITYYNQYRGLELFRQLVADWAASEEKQRIAE
jgi:hypothetical protein